MAHRPDLPCADCGKLMWRSRKRLLPSSLPEGLARCRDCRYREHGSAGYGRGCRCEVCREAVAGYARRYRVMVMERDGVSLSAKRKTPHTWISAKVRFAVYERDGWVCQLCDEPVDRALHPNDRFAASLDHIECKSWALIPDHSPGNLRLAHRACNARRKDRVDA